MRQYSTYAGDDYDRRNDCQSECLLKYSSRFYRQFNHQRPQCGLADQILKLKTISVVEVLSDDMQYYKPIFEHCYAILSFLG